MCGFLCFFFKDFQVPRRTKRESIADVWERKVCLSGRQLSVLSKTGSLLLLLLLLIDLVVLDGGIVWQWWAVATEKADEKRIEENPSSKSKRKRKSQAIDRPVPGV